MEDFRRRQGGSGGSTPSGTGGPAPLPSPSSMDLNAIFKELGIGNLSGGKDPRARGSSSSNPFGSASAEFRVAPMAVPAGVIQDPLARIQSGLPEYDNMVRSMYGPPTPAPGTPPTNPHLISGLSQALQDRLASIWGRIGKGAPMPTTLDDYLAYYRANPMPSQNRTGQEPRPRQATISSNPFAAQGH